MRRESRVREWTMSLREGQKGLPPAREECKSYYKVSGVLLLGVRMEMREFNDEEMLTLV